MINETAILAKMSKAKSLLQELPLLIQFGYHSNAISRMYYACYHATQALLLTKNIITKTHNGQINQLHNEFVSTGNFDKTQAAFLSLLLNLRIDSDYSDEINFKRDDIGELMEKTNSYINFITSIIVK
jgi:uncharacterized protein (UPF0332 family)